MNAKVIISVSGLLLLSMFLMISAITSTNALGNMFLYMTVAMGIFGMLLPRQGVYLMIFLSGYIDFFKRLMIFGEYTTPKDIAYVLSAPLAVAAGAVLGSVMSLVLGKAAMKKQTVIAFVLATVAFALTVGGALVGGAGMRSLGLAVNAGAYAYMIFLIPIHFSKAEDMRKLLVTIFITFIPVALYTFRHRYFGLADFEYDYLLSGLSQEARILWESSALRTFSTMNGAAVVSTMLSIMVLLCFVSLRPYNQKSSFIQKVAKASLALLFMAGAYFTVSRGGWVCGVAAIGFYIMFQRKITTIAVYATAIIGFGAVVAVAPTVHKHRLLDDAQVYLNKNIAGDDAGVYESRALVLGTFYDRVLGWRNLTQEPYLYTPFGFKLAGREASNNPDDRANYLGHDITIHLLIKIGYVGVLVMLVIGAISSYKLHKFVLSLAPGTLEKKICTLALALAGAIFFGSFGNASQLEVFPQNFYFFLFLGMVFAIYCDKVNKKHQLEKERLENEFVRSQQEAESGGFQYS